MSCRQIRSGTARRWMSGPTLGLADFQLPVTPGVFTIVVTDGAQHQNTSEIHALGLTQEREGLQRDESSVAATV